MYFSGEPAQIAEIKRLASGAVSTENIAFTRWLTLLQDGVLLDEQNCQGATPFRARALHRCGGSLLIACRVPHTR
ncbi:hypothetical protein OM364_24825, partial [Escherichia albertii]|nr:hypothetical protein [Escherichia albertii]